MTFDSPTQALVGDLDTEAVAAVLPGRELRCYPAALSAEVDALAWAREGAPDGALVVAEYQASPRGRGGLEWETPVGRGLVFAMVLRERLRTPFDGPLYLAGAVALCEVLGESARIEWPDTILVDGAPVAALAAQLDPDNQQPQWAVVGVRVHDAEPPRAPLLAQVVEALERQLATPGVERAAAYRERCTTLGERVRARLVPLGPAGPEVTGTAKAVLPNGALVIDVEEGRSPAIQPQQLGLLERAFADEDVDAASLSGPPRPRA